MAKFVYGFKDKAAAQRAAQYFGQNPQDQKQQALYSEAVPARIRLVEIPDGIDGYGHATDDVQFPTSEVEIVRTTTNPQSLLSETSETFHAIQAAPLEPTNYPAEAHVVAITDTFNQTFLVTPTPSEVFGKLNEYWDGTDFSTEIEVNLDTGFTVCGSSVLRAFPSPSLTEKIPYNTSVTCRYVKAKGAWFFFRPTEADVTATISGNALGLITDPENVFISQIASNETVSYSQINAVHQFGEITGSNDGDMWRKFPTELIGPPQTVADSYTVQSPRWVSDGRYAWRANVTDWRISTIEFYGPIMKGSVGYLYPGNRLINGETWWSQGRDAYAGSGMSVFFTSKYDAQGNVSAGWTYSDTLGKVLGPNDSEPFEPAGFHESSLIALMQTAGLEFLKPEWTCSSEFGEYQPNSLASGTIQLGSLRWVASDGRTGITPFYFTRSWNGGNGDQYERWFGRYKCEAFNETFINISYQNIAAFPYTDYKFCLGNFGLPYGGYVSSSAPSRSAPVTFTYQAGPRGGLTASLKFVRSYGGNEDWVLETTWKGKKETANYYRTEGTETLNGSYRNVFGNITKSGDTWTVNGRNATVGNLTFEGDLSTTAPNVFNFQHSITLTFDQFVQGPEFQKIYVCSPEVIS